MFDQNRSNDSSYNLFEQSFSKKLIEANIFIEDNCSTEKAAQDAIESLSRLSPSILLGHGGISYNIVNNVTVNSKFAQKNESPSCNSISNTDSPSQGTDKKKSSQERNRLAAIKSRLKKKEEHMKLLEMLSALRAENDMLRQTVERYELILTEMHRNGHLYSMERYNGSQ